MGTPSLRSLLLAAFVLSNCITWTASRHHYTHNVNGHRSRHRRQGAGLFLPASYVIPEGEGSGAWGEWGDVSPCSRTCGGGVASQKRICLQFGSDGQPLCTGGDTKYFSCQTHDCPEGAGDFRAEQCANFNDKLFRDHKIYSWVPYTKGHNPCELNCMPRGERFYYRQREKVVDGTRCNDDSFDVCVNGTCQAVGCDMMLGSKAREDKCRECRGNGTDCKTMEGLINDPELRGGYNDILLLPQGATNIVIEELKASSNYLALRAKEYSKYYLNGDYHIDFPRSLLIAGAIWHYERNQQGFAAPDKLRCVGPINETLYLSILLLGENVGVKYEYSIPSNLAPRPTLRYDWAFNKFSPCSATCGGGFQMRTVTCRSRDDLAQVDESLCDAGVKPATNQTCNTQACAPQWVEGPWSPCSKPCGEGGTRSREVRCERIITNGVTFRFPSIVSDKECFDLLGTKPSLYQECNQNATCPTWFTGPWKPCNKQCGEGVQTRQVVCHTRVNGRVQVFDDNECTDEKPPSEKTCNLHPCSGIDFVLSDWSGCDSCLSTSRTRLAKCVTKDREVVEYSMCAYHPVPILEEPCEKSKLPKCEAQWYATQWSNCSVECGSGVQSRRVFCGVFNGATVEEVADSQCDLESRYKDTKPCEVPKEKCPAKWFTGPWTECSKQCGGGEQTRQVMCLIGDNVVGTCSQSDIPDLLQTCNLKPCNEDEVLPLDSRSTPIMDEYYDYEECEDGDEFVEVGAEVDIEDDLDSTLFPPNESDELTTDFPTDEGSGFDTTLIVPETTESSTEISTSTVTNSVDVGQTTLDITLTNADKRTTESTNFDNAESAAVDVTNIDTDSTSTKYTISENSDITVSTESTTELSTTSDTEFTASDITTSGDNETISTESTNTETDETGSTEEITTSSNVGITTELSTADSVSTQVSVTDASTPEQISDSTSSYSTTEVNSESSTTQIDDRESTSERGTSEASATEASTTEASTAEASTSEVSASEASTTEASTTEASTTEASTTEASTTEATASEASTTEASTSDASTSEASTSEASTSEASTSEASTSEAGTTEASTTEASTSEASTTEASTSEATTSEATTSEASTSEATTSEVSPSESSTSEASTSDSSTTEASTTEGSTTESSVSTTETTSQSTGESSTSETVSEGTTDGSTESTGTTDFTSTKYTESTIGEDTETATYLSSTISTDQVTTSQFSTKTDWGTTMKSLSKQGRCKPKKIAKCLRSKYGCCPNMKTPADGPFDQGCPEPKPCDKTKYKCCSDGVSPAAGPNNKGCPVVNCNETLYGCCLSDNTTAAEGNDQEGCPKPLPACETSKYGCCADGKTDAKGLKKQGCPETVTPKPEKKPEGCVAAKFGCCADNKTEATGPDGAGCPCNITEFGCCPDGLSPAAGTEMEGCAVSCNTSVYGCCPDRQTPAHGPEYEGCCLQTAFGCCPDNYKPADGPHLEGCGCQFARYGCCPDNVTIARGPDNDGCGCQYTKFGCCPDRHTEAQGPELKGCDCTTYQFGCCPDGYTIAKGPQNQGCECKISEYGCCGDGKTAAKGPSELGCDCSNSQFGCCPDGVTEAKGEKFLNCTDVPENRQAACSLPNERGPCNNFTVKWYYDVVYGGCTRFWYGGCEGNGNQFDSQSDCEDVCTQPSPKDTCKLPSVRGSCSNPTLRWYYDSNREQCLQFEYSGCLGNANRFLTRDSCQKQCEPARVEDQCSLPIERGPCAGTYGRWGYSPESGTCEQFIWGGCEGNPNRFGSEAACLQRCNPPGQPQPECSLPQETGNCTDKLAVWSFRAEENRCVPFYYTGCGGNDNRFESEAACALTCPSAYDKNSCVLPAVTGTCGNYTLRWFYDTRVKQCRQFYYGGCDGNENNFMTEEQCQNSCVELLSTPAPTPPPQAPVLDNNFCFLESDPGPCDRFVTRWSYDVLRGDCIPFEYGGCGGNTNNFDNLETCQSYCSHAQDLCQLPAQAGPCAVWSVQWFYDASVDQCRQFHYGGCEGNNNRFASQQACEQRCTRPEPISSRTTPTTPATTTTTVAVITDVTTTPRIPSYITPGCQVSPTLEECVEAGQVWYLDVNQRACVEHTNAASGVTCRLLGTYPSQEACERACGTFRNLNVCRYEVDPGPCDEIVPKIYYDEGTRSCNSFVYGGCHGGPNRFSSVEECEEVCKPVTNPCEQPAEPGNCVGYNVMWYYDEARQACGRFVYTGCGGNDNRFNTESECEDSCSRRVTTSPIPRPRTTAATITTTTTTTTTYRPPIQTERDACSTPVTLEPCGQNITTYYYNTQAGACLSAGFGACGYANSYRSEEECERQCGAFRHIDVCKAVLDPGPCIYSVDKVYWDAASGRCLPFAYGGCHGGPNRFSTVEECEEICGETGPEPACLQAVATGRGGCGIAARRWWYDAAAADCRAFVFLGCDGNDNNFASYEECASHCRPDNTDNEVVPSCQHYEDYCARLRCEGQVDRRLESDGCVRCACAPTTTSPTPTPAPVPSPAPVDCEPARLACAALECQFVPEKFVGPDGCEACQCVDPCAETSCQPGERCVYEPYVSPATGDVSYPPECRPVNKSGWCPKMAANGTTTCEPECYDDADCRGVGKCCARGCQYICVSPLPTTLPPTTILTTTYTPDVPKAPLVDTETVPEVSVAEGGKATLRCLFHGNPPPSITWRRGEITIEGDRERYRLLADGALEIVSIYRNDTGVYICVGTNLLGTAEQQVHLQVNDPEEGPAGIAGAARAVVRGTLGSPLLVRCLAYGYPPPSIYWYHGRDGPMVPYSSELYEARGNVLQIRSLIKEALGEYICQAYNGMGKAAEWSVTVELDEPDNLPPTTAETSTQAPSTTLAAVLDYRYSGYNVPVVTRILPDRTTVDAGSEVNIRCDVDGYPMPDVYWTKDSVRLVPTDRITPTEARLTISNANINDSGEYGCHASNALSQHSSTVRITVQGVYIPAKCTDNPFFANCELIVRSRFCNHRYYSKFCCKSCVEAGQLNPQEITMQADEPWKRKK